MPNKKNIEGKGFDKHPEHIGGGRPKGLKNRSTMLRKWIDVYTKIKHPILEVEINVTLEEAISLSLMSKALEGDIQAIKEFNDTLYGKITDKTDITTGGDKINITFVKK